MAVGSERAEDGRCGFATQASLKLRLADSAVANQHHVDKRAAGQSGLEGLGVFKVDLKARVGQVKTFDPLAACLRGVEQQRAKLLNTLGVEAAVGDVKDPVQSWGTAVKQHREQGHNAIAAECRAVLEVPMKW